VERDRKERRRWIGRKGGEAIESRAKGEVGKLTGGGGAV